MKQGAVYRWKDALGNENVKFVDEFEISVHAEIIGNIMSHRDAHKMKASDLRLMVMITDRYWVSYNLLREGDDVETWRVYRN